MVNRNGMSFTCPNTHRTGTRTKRCGTILNLKHKELKGQDKGRGDPLVVEAKNELTRLVIADIAATPPRFPVTACFGVWPRAAHVFANSAVRETFVSS
jgi:hypothetical protein